MENDTNSTILHQREQNNNSTVDKKKDADQCAVARDSEYIINILKKLPIFKGLSDLQHKKIFKICYHKRFKKDKYVCEEVDKSNEMYILLSGKLKVIYHGKTLITYISPITLVGELALFTSEQGFSSVIATEESAVLSIQKEDIFNLLKNDRSMTFCVLMNFISVILARKLRKNDEIIEELRKKISSNNSKDQ